MPSKINPSKTMTDHWFFPLLPFSQLCSNPTLGHSQPSSLDSSLWLPVCSGDQRLESFSRDGLSSLRDGLICSDRAVWSVQQVGPLQPPDSSLMEPGCCVCVCVCCCSTCVCFSLPVAALQLCKLPMALKHLHTVRPRK